MKKLYYILGFVSGIHLIVGCKGGSKTTAKDDQKSLELRIADVVVVDNATSKPLLTTNGYEIHPSEGITYPRIIEMPSLSDDTKSLRFRMTWIAHLEDTNTITIEADGYEPKTLSLDQILRVKGDKKTSKKHTVELRMQPRSRTNRGAPTGISSPISHQNPSNRAGGRTSNVRQ